MRRCIAFSCARRTRCTCRSVFVCCQAIDKAVISRRTACLFCVWGSMWLRRAAQAKAHRRRRCRIAIKNTRISKNDLRHWTGPRNAALRLTESKRDASRNHSDEGHREVSEGHWHLWFETLRSKPPRPPLAPQNPPMHPPVGGDRRLSPFFRRRCKVSRSGQLLPPPGAQAEPKNHTTKYRVWNIVHSTRHIHRQVMRSEDEIARVRASDRHETTKLGQRKYGFEFEMDREKVQ